MATMDARARWAHAFGAPLGIIVGYVRRGDVRLTGIVTGQTAWHVGDRSYRARYIKAGPWVLLVANQRHQLPLPSPGRPDPGAADLVIYWADGWGHEERPEGVGRIEFRGPGDADPPAWAKAGDMWSRTSRLR